MPKSCEGRRAESRKYKNFGLRIAELRIVRAKSDGQEAAAINVDNQIAAASSDDVFCTLVYAPDGLTIRGALADRDEALGRVYT